MAAPEAPSLPHIVLLGGDGGPSGVPRHIVDLVRALRGRARLTVLSEADRGGYSALAGLGARHVMLDGLASRLDPRRAARGQAALADWLAAHPAQLVWAHARLPVLMLRRILQAGHWQPRDTRLALTYHGLPFGPGHRIGTGTVSRRVEARLLGAVPPLDLVFLTQDQAQRMAAAMGPAMDRHRAHVLANASHLGPLPAAASRRPGRHLVMTGRAGWQKNYAGALRLLRHLPGDIHLSLCGAGTDSARFGARARRLAGAGAPRLHLLGELEDVRPVLAAADGYLLTSRYEGQPIGALEAMEAGLPMALSDFEGARALTRDHPCACVLTGPRAAQAAQVDALLTRYLAARAALTGDIRAHWAARYHPDRFAAAARALVFEQLLR